MNIDPNNFDALLDLVKYEWIDLTVVGPEDPLSRGIVDVFEKAGRRIMGPNQASAQLEASKLFTNVRLVVSKLDKSIKTELQRFTLTTTVVLPGAKKLPAPGKAG